MAYYFFSYYIEDLAKASLVFQLTYLEYLAEMDMLKAGEKKNKIKGRGNSWETLKSQ